MYGSQTNFQPTFLGHSFYFHGVPQKSFPKVSQIVSGEVSNAAWCGGTGEVFGQNVQQNIWGPGLEIKTQGTFILRFGKYFLMWWNWRSIWPKCPTQNIWGVYLWNWALKLKHNLLFWDLANTFWCGGTREVFGRNVQQNICNTWILESLALEPKI